MSYCLRGINPGFDALAATRIGSAKPLPETMKRVPLTELSYATFAGLLHSKFQVRSNAPAPVEIELVEATAHQSGRETTQAQEGRFSLVFAGPLHQFLPQRTYLFEHEKLGAFDLFIVPISKDQNAFHYEAIFNRPVPPGTLAPPA